MTATRRARRRLRRAGWASTGTPAACCQAGLVNIAATSGDSTTNQAGLVNIAALNGNAGSLPPNLACGADIVEDLNVLGFALGGSSLGGSLLGSDLLSGPTGILTGAPDFLLSGLTADVRVLANVLVLF